MVEIKKLNPDSIERLHQYLANRTLHTESARYRGRVVEMSIYLELVLAKILSKYFATSEKVGLLNSMVFDRMYLQRKLNTLKTILKTQYPNIWRKENINFKKLDKLIIFRNNIAHSVLNSSPEYSKKIREQSMEFIKKGKKDKFLDGIEFGFYENHNWVFKNIKWNEIEAYHKGIYNGINKIEDIGKQIIPEYEITLEE
mgnify:FL=1